MKKKTGLARHSLQSFQLQQTSVFSTPLTISTVNSVLRKSPNTAAIIIKMKRMQSVVLVVNKCGTSYYDFFFQLRHFCPVISTAPNIGYNIGFNRDRRHFQVISVAIQVLFVTGHLDYKVIVLLSFRLRQLLDKILYLFPNHNR